MSATVAALTQQDFDATVATSATPVLVDFWAEWCGPCKAISPILEELARDLDSRLRVFKVDVDKETALAARFEVQVIPTLVLFKNGTIVQRMVGMSNKAALRQKIEPHLA